MKAPLLFYAFEGKLYPSDEAAAERLHKIKGGSLVQVEIKQPRNLNHTKKYFALLKLVLANLPDGIYRDVDALHDSLKIAMGYMTPIKLLNGDDAYLPQSISFASMDQPTFSAYYDKTCDFLAKHFLPNVTSLKARSQLLEIMGLPPDLEWHP